MVKLEPLITRYINLNTFNVVKIPSKLSNSKIFVNNHGPKISGRAHKPVIFLSLAIRLWDHYQNESFPTKNHYQNNSSYFKNLRRHTLKYI